MKKTLIVSLLAWVGLGISAHAALIVDTTYTTDTNVGSDTQYFLEGDTGGTTATWTINSGVTVTGGRFFIATSGGPSLGLATFVVDGGGTLDIDRTGVYNLRLGQNETSEAGALIIKNGSSVLMTGTTESAFEQSAGSFITLDGLGSTFQWKGTWDAVNNKTQSQNSPGGDIPLNAINGLLEVTDLGTGFIHATVIGAPPVPPVWQVDPIEDTTNVNKPYSGTLADKAFDPNGDSITFGKVSGPAWLNVATNGVLTGTPLTADAGVTNSFVVVATDVDGATSADLNIFVQEALAPTWQVDPIEDTANVNKPYSGTLADKASDPNGDSITFSKSSGPAWLSVATNGVLTGTPLTADAGVTNSFVVVATDVDGATSADLNIFVQEALAPTWPVDPVDGGRTFIDVEYSDTLADKVDEPNGDEITFGKVGGPAWLNVATNGVLTGTPVIGDLGMNSFVVSAGDVDGTNNAVLNILVEELQMGDSVAISVNFYRSESYETLAASTLAGLSAYVYDHWNTTTGDVSGTLATLDDSAGNPTAASVTWSCAGTYHDGTATTDAMAGIGNAQVARGYLNDGGSGASWTVTGIPYDSYTAVLYLSTDHDGDTYVPFVVNGTSNSVTASPKSTYRTDPNWDGSNTIVVSNLVGNLVVAALPKAGSTRGSVAGFQIIKEGYAPGAQVTDLVIAGPVAGGTGMELSWTGENTKLYGVETNSNLIISGDWATWQTGLSGDGGTITVTNTIGPDQTFYRVISE